MSVRTRLVVLVVLVALVPLGVSTLTTLGIYQRAHRATLEDLFRASAEQGVTEARTRLDGVATSLRVLAAQTIQWSALSDRERDGAVSLVYQQFDDVAVATLVDEKGDGITTSFVDPSAPADTLPAHPRFAAAALPGFGAHIPFDASRASGVALGETFLPSGERTPILPIAVRVSGTRNAPWVVAVGLSLRSVCREIARGDSSVERFLLDAQGRVLCGPPASRPLEPFDPDLLKAALATPDGVASHTSSGGEVLAAVAPLPWGWRVLVRQDAAVAFAAGRRMRAQSAAWILAGLGLAVGTGLVLARGTNRAIETLARGARELEGGNLAYRIPEGPDEFGRLAATFNQMSAQIQKRDAEIKAWNAELQKRVEERTRDLEEAQAELLQSHKQAAVGALGAGMAHEINNPLTTVLGVALVLEAEAKEKGEAEKVETLGMLVAEAKRIKRILEDLARVGTESGPKDPMPVNETIEAALASARPALEGEGIAVESRLASGVPPILGRPAELSSVLGQLLANARVAVKKTRDPRIVVSSEVISGKLVKIAVEDNGVGIAPENLDRIFEPFFTTKGDWSGKGLGLSTAFRIVRDHYGTIKAASTPGRGTTLSMTFPVARKGTTLE